MNQLPAAQKTDTADKTYDPLDSSVQQNPYEYYTKMRRDEPVKWVESLRAFAVAEHCQKVRA